jgi:TolB-like protein/DNA-binding winged helix-turn-helix (wHTH) protein
MNPSEKFCNAAMDMPTGRLVYEFGDFRVDTLHRLLVRRSDGQVLPLSSRAFDALLYFLTHRDVLLEKATLMAAIWPNVIVEDNNLTQHVSALRRAFGESRSDHRFIVTVPGRGYRFVAEVTVQPVETEPTPSTHPPIQSEVPASVRRKAWRPWFAGACTGVLLLALALYLVKPFHAAQAFIYLPSANTGSTDSRHEPSIAVLPFVAPNTEPDQEYFADSLTEELSARLAQLRGLRLVGRTSVLSFKGSQEDSRRIGAALDVDHLLRGSVRKAGEELRVTVELVDARNGASLWSQTYARREDDVSSILKDIALSVAGELSVALRSSANGALPDSRNSAAYEAYLAAQRLVTQPGTTHYMHGIALLEHAVELDPGFTRAWSDLAWAYQAAPAGEGVPDAEYALKARAALSRALQIAPDSSTLLAQAGEMSMWVVGDWQMLEVRLRRQLEATGGADYRAARTLAAVLLNVGRPLEAVQYARDAVRAEPLILAASVQLSQAYLENGDLRSAEQEYERGQRLGSENYLADKIGLLELGMARHDRDRIGRFLTLHADRDARIVRVKYDDLSAVITELRRMLQDPAVSASSFRTLGVAEWAAYFGERELALEALHRTEQNTSDMFMIWLPVFKDVRKLPEFKRLTRKLHLVDYWRNTGNWGQFCHPSGADDFECS